MEHTSNTTGCSQRGNGQHAATAPEPLTLSEKHCKFVLQRLLPTNGGAVDFEVLARELGVQPAWAQELIRRLVEKGHAGWSLEIRP